jgi:hypothetical protein
MIKVHSRQLHHRQYAPIDCPSIDTDTVSTPMARSAKRTSRSPSCRIFQKRLFMITHEENTLGIDSTQSFSDRPGSLRDQTYDESCCIATKGCRQWA